MDTTDWTIGEWIKCGVYCAVIAVAALCFYSMCGAAKPPPVLDEYGCAVGQPITAHTLIIADLTDPYSPEQIKAFHIVVESLIAKEPPAGMVSIATVEKLPVRFVASRCSPPHVSGASNLWEYPDQSWVQLNAKYYHAFVQPVRYLEAGLSLTQTEPSSPIVQTIAQAIDHLGRHWSEAKNRRLVIFSDMMENVPGYSQYSRSACLDFGAAKGKVSYLAQSLDLNGTTVAVHYLIGFPADRPYQGERHRQFWRDLFQAQGATVQFIDLPTRQQNNRQ